VGHSRGFQLFLLTSAASAGVFARTALSPLQEQMRIALDLSDNMMAMLQGPALAVPVVLGAAPIGLLIDRYSRVRLVAAFAACMVLGSVVTAMANNFIVLVAARCTVGLAGPAIWMACMSLISDLYAADKRGRANMAVVIGQCVGNSAAFALGGALLGAVVAPSNQWSRALLWLSVPLGVVALLTLMMREPHRKERVLERPTLRQALEELWLGRGTIGPILLGLGMLGVADGAAVTWVAPTLARRFTLSPDQIGASMGFVLLASGLLGPLLGGFVADFCERRGGARRTMMALTILSFVAIPTGAFALAGSPLALNASFFLFMLLGSAVIVTGTTLFTIVIPNELRGVCLGMLSAAFLLLGFGIAPPMVSLLSGAMGGTARIGDALATVCVCTCLCGTSAFWIGSRRPMRALARQDFA
jgi:predicted MFS family arabinose efflux permease